MRCAVRSGCGRPTCSPTTRADGTYILAERLGIADDLGMPTHAGSPAWLIAAGEAMAVD